MTRSKYVQPIGRPFYAYAVLMDHACKRISTSQSVSLWLSVISCKRTRHGVPDLLDLFPGTVTGRMVRSLKCLLGIIAKAARWPNLRTLTSISNSEPSMKGPIKKPCSLHTY